MKNNEKTVLLSLVETIEQLSKEQADRQVLCYEMFTKLEEKIRLLEHSIESLESKVDTINVKDSEEVTRRDCNLCTIS